MSLAGEITFGILGLILLLICSALISGSEIAYFSLSPNDHERLEQEGDNISRRMLWLLSQPEKLLATILINNNFINIAIVLLAEIVVGQILPKNRILGWVNSWQSGWIWMQNFTADTLANLTDFTITVVGITFLLVLFGEVTPKVYASLNSIQLARFMSGPLSLTMQLFAPLSKLLVSWSHRLERRLSAKQSTVGLTSKEDIGEAIDLTVSQENGGDKDMDILKRIIKFAEVNVRQIMRSRVDVVAINELSTYPEVLVTIRESGYSRFPVYANDADNVTGMLYAKDLLLHLHEAPEFGWQHLIRTDVLFVPESKKINDLLRDFQIQHLHMAVVVDEYGGTSGIVTLEDVLEEVIGEIQDEFDDEPDVIFQKIDDYNYVFEGKSMLNDVCRIMNIESNSFGAIKGESESLAGLILERLGRMPKKDQEIILSDFSFKALTVSKRRIEKILITLLRHGEE
ncbi:MAG: gliding motility-associated protein GldE [Bacteroidetes bacterium]|nr:MAG: gliding motility-associated protein GldE [Bacteroidota bacterium]PTM12799.1 MAG: gliding motility-associated protein GldE [Bacteroidota bacterium]